ADQPRGGQVLAAGAGGQQAPSLVGRRQPDLPEGADHPPAGALRRQVPAVLPTVQSRQRPPAAGSTFSQTSQLKVWGFSPGRLIWTLPRRIRWSSRGLSTRTPVIVMV